MKPDLKVLTPEDAPKPPQDENQSPAQGEMPFAVVAGEPVNRFGKCLRPPLETPDFAGVLGEARG